MDGVNKPTAEDPTPGGNVVDQKPASGGTSIPTWAWGAAAGAAVAVSGIAVTTYHFVTRRWRAKEAKEAAMEFVREDMTPRGDPVESTPRADNPQPSGII